MTPIELSSGQYQLVYNCLSLAIAAMFASFAFFVQSRQQLTAAFRPAMIMASVVVLIAGYHYFRIFNNWTGSFQFESGVYKATTVPFNDAYRYVDWFLTVPLLCAELISVMNIKSGARGPMMGKLVIAAALMIALGYPGEISDTGTGRALWGTLSTVPFVYIVYILWGELSKVASTESAKVKILLRNTRLLLIATWGFYPIAYLLPLLGVSHSNALVGVQVGYSIADIAAKCGYGVMIYAIARAKMEAANESAVASEGLVT